MGKMMIVLGVALVACCGAAQEKSKVEVKGGGEKSKEEVKAKGDEGKVKTELKAKREAQERAKPKAKMSKSVPKGWIEDFEAAKGQAKKEKKKILLAFSGSDWCGWCVKLENETFSKSKFVKKAKKDYVLVMIDSPRDKGILSDLAKKQNQKLTEEFKVSGFPCGVVLDSDGKEIGRIGGYVQGGPDAYLKRMDNVGNGPMAE